METLANPCREARPLGQSEHGERAHGEGKKKKERGGGMEVELAVLYKVFVGRCSSEGELAANRSSGGKTSEKPPQTCNNVCRRSGKIGLAAREQAGEKRAPF